MTNILALDLGTTMGWAMRVDGAVSSGATSFKPTHFDSVGCAFTRFRRWLGTTPPQSLDDVVYEAVRHHKGTIASQTYGGFMATLQTWCDANGIPYEGVPVGTIKKFATGNGHATKADMAAAMAKRGCKPQDDNEADALALLYWRVEGADFREKGNEEMTLHKPDVSGDRGTLFDLFKEAENRLWDANIEAGLPRFWEFAHFLFLKLQKERGNDPLWDSLKAEKNKIAYLNGTVIPHLQEKYNAPDVFEKTRILQESAVKKIASLLDKRPLASFDADILGDAYEYFLKDNVSLKQNLGQYFTPRPLVNIMVDLVAPTNGDAIYDPFCGAGGLLTGAFNAVKEAAPAPKQNKGQILFFGRDASGAARVAKMNAILHWGDACGIAQVANTLAHPVHEKYAIGLTNVPFARDAKNYPYDGLYENGLARKKTDALCILHLFQSIRKGGRMAAIVPEGFLFGAERAPVRRFLTDNADLRLVVSLPHGIFAPYTNVKTALVYLDNIRCPAQQKYFWHFDVDPDNRGRHSLEALYSANFNAASGQELTARGFIQVPFEKIRQNNENWIGKHYQEGGGSRSAYPLVPLGKLVSFISTGFSYRTHNLSEEGIPLFTLKSVKKDLFFACETKFLKQGTQTHEKNSCGKGDLLVAMKDKSKEEAILGKGAIADKKGVFASELAKVEVRAKSLLLKDYLYYFFRNDAYIQEIKKFSAGSIVKSISVENIGAVKIPLPPIAVQQEAVNELNRYEKMLLSQKETANFFHEKCQERLKALWG